MIIAFDAAWAGIGVCLMDRGKVVRTHWRAFPSNKRTIAGVVRWLDELKLPEGSRIVVETTNVHAGGQEAFGIGHQVAVKECVQLVATWAVCRGFFDPAQVLPATWRAHYARMMPRPRPKGAPAWKSWGIATASRLYPGCLDNLGIKSKEDTADAVLIAGWFEAI